MVWNILHFSIYWECHHRNWRSPSYFSEGWRKTTNQKRLRRRISIGNRSLENILSTLWAQRLRFANWKDPPFCSWVNPRFQWFIFNSYVTNYQRVSTDDWWRLSHFIAVFFWFLIGLAQDGFWAGNEACERQHCHLTSMVPCYQLPSLSPTCQHDLSLSVHKFDFFWTISLLPKINGHFRILKWRYLPYKAYVREYTPKIWPTIWYCTSILGSWNSHWQDHPFWECRSYPCGLQLLRFHPIFASRDFGWRPMKYGGFRSPLKQSIEYSVEARRFCKTLQLGAHRVQF